MFDQGLTFKTRFYLKDRLGEERIVRKFLWWPRSFDHKYGYWLRWVNIRERICAMDIGGSMEYGKFEYSWQEVGFASPDGVD